MHSRSTNRGALAVLAFLVFSTFSVQAAVVADLSITIVGAPNPVIAGNTLTYTITVKNLGPSTAENVVWTSATAPITTFQSLSTRSGWTCTTPTVGSEGPVSCTTPSLSSLAAANVFTFRVKTDPTVEGPFTFDDSADVKSTTLDLVPGNNHADANEVDIGYSSDIGITISDSPDPVTAGGNITYTIVVTNSGPTDAHDITVTDILPEGTTFVSAQPSTRGTCSFFPLLNVTGTVSCFFNENALRSLPAGLSRSVNLVLMARAGTAGTTISNTASTATTLGDFPWPDPNLANNTATTTTTVLPDKADLSIAASDAPDPVTAGQNLTYSITGTNNGPNPAQNLRIADVLPGGTRFVSASAGSGGSCSTPAAGGTGTVVCTFAGATAAAATRHVTLVVAVLASFAEGSVLSNTATTSSDTSDPNGGNNAVTVATTVHAVVLPDKADLSIAATDAPDPVTAGQNLTYSITATNNGPNPAQNLRISDVLPGGTAFVSASAGSGSCTTPAVGAAGSVVCTFAGATAAGAIQRVTLVVAVSAGLGEGTVLSNTVTTSSDTFDPNGGNNASTVTTTVHVAPPLPDTCSNAPPRLLVPIVLDVTSGSAHFTTELSLTNKSDRNALLSLTYTAALGDKKGSGTVADILPGGRQLVLADALQYLRQQGMDIPLSEASPQQGGTLLITFNGVPSPSDVAATARTTAATAAPQPAGAAGLAYSGMSPCEGITDKAVLYGLRSTSDDRSNVAVFNTSDQPVSFKVTVLSGAGDGTTAVIRQGDTLEPWGWTQYTRILDGTSITDGVCAIERTSSTGSFGAYLVINDNATNDGSFSLPLTGAFSGDHLTLPVLVETASFESELVLSNGGGSPASLSLEYVESLSPALGAGGSVTLTLAPGEQRILPNAIDVLRKGGASIGPENAASYAGAVRVTVFGVPISQAFVGARTASRSAAGGQFGLFTPPTYPGQEASDEAFIFGLEANSTCRSNVAALNAGASGAGSITLELSAFDGDDGLVKGSETLTLSPGQWAQVNGFLQKYGVANGWARVRRVAGSAGWVAYGVVNDGGSPGERTGDGAFVPMAK